MSIFTFYNPGVLEDNFRNIVPERLTVQKEEPRNSLGLNYTMEFRGCSLRIANLKHGLVGRNYL